MRVKYSHTQIVVFVMRCVCESTIRVSAIDVEVLCLPKSRHKIALITLTFAQDAYIKTSLNGTLLAFLLLY
jgi:hypothetical protein